MKRSPLRQKRPTPRRNEGRVKQGRIKPNGRFPTAEQERYWNSLPRGCVLCGRDAIIHHILAAAPGKARRRDHWHVVKVCPAHHNMGPDSIHGLGSESAFAKVWGVDLVAVAVENLRRWREANGEQEAPLAR